MGFVPEMKNEGKKNPLDYHPLLELMWWLFLLSSSLTMTAIFLIGWSNGGKLSLEMNSYGEMYLEMTLFVVLFGTFLFVSYRKLKGVWYGWK